MKYRLYVDEVGNADLKCCAHVNHRYLSLNGVILEWTYVADRFAPALESLKRQYFGYHPDDAVILHRKEMVNATGPFGVLQDKQVRHSFDNDLLALLSDLEFRVITVVMDKYEHKERYKVWQFSPYHYCLQLILERYVQWLGRQEATGGMCWRKVAEARKTPG